MMNHFFALSLCFALFSLNLQAQKLSRTERKIVEKVKSLDEASISFLEEVVKTSANRAKSVAFLNMNSYFV